MVYISYYYPSQSYMYITTGDREMASVWIRIWDDASDSFKELVKRGYDYTEL